MDYYERLIKSISTGEESAPARPMSEARANKLLCAIVGRIRGIKKLRDGAYLSKHCFMYVGGFPAPHVAFDNLTGTERLHTVYSLKDFKRMYYLISIK